MAIAPGVAAPDFNLMDNNEQYVSLAGLRGKKVLLSWHPLAWTPVCTDQMRALENNWDAFSAKNVIPLGMSVDPQPCKKAWAAALSNQSLCMLADFWPHGKVARDYGIFDEVEGVSQRANILIDENGKVIWVKVYESDGLPDINEILSVCGV